MYFSQQHKTMAHYAFLDDQNIVTEVIVGIDEDADDIDYEVFYGNIRGQVCKRTSYNTFKNIHSNGKTPFRGTYAGIGFRYDPDTDKFYPLSPFASWVFNEADYEWEPPIAMPDDGMIYRWDEDSISWEFVANPADLVDQ